jgi:hypothetical protein
MVGGIPLDATRNSLVLPTLGLPVEQPAHAYEVTARLASRYPQPESCGRPPPPARPASPWDRATSRMAIRTWFVRDKKVFVT